MNYHVFLLHSTPGSVSKQLIPVTDYLLVHSKPGSVANWTDTSDWLSTGTFTEYFPLQFLE